MSLQNSGRMKPIHKAKMYCGSCDDFYIDIYDQMHRPCFQSQCPHCLSIYVVNVTKLQLTASRLKSDNEQFASWAYRALYRRLIYKLKQKAYKASGDANI